MPQKLSKDTSQSRHLSKSSFSANQSINHQNSKQSPRRSKPRAKSRRSNPLWSASESEHLLLLEPPYAACNPLLKHSSSFGNDETLLAAEASRKKNELAPGAGGDSVAPRRRVDEGEAKGVRGGGDGGERGLEGRGSQPSGGVVPGSEDSAGLWSPRVAPLRLLFLPFLSRPPSRAPSFARFLPPGGG